MFETLSGLARAFSYAKARALLVSHLACKFGRRGEVDNKGRRRAEGLAKLGGERVLYGRFNVDRVSPSLFMPNEGRVSSAADAFARDYFARLHPYFVDRGLNDYDLRRLESCAMVVGPMLISSGLPLSHLSALEIGCGKGLKAFPVASLFKRYVGVDLDRDAIESAARTAADLEIGNLHFSCSNATEIIANPERYGSGFDIVFLHAVMEHLTLEERVAIFELIRNVRSVGGAVMLLETPNRLFPFDHHSSELHFVDALPDSVALRYIRKKSKRKAAQAFVSEDLRPSGDGSAILLSEPDPIARLYRLGRGLSYHDFELDYYDDSNCFAPAMDGYHPLLLNHQPLTRCELHVNDYFRDNNMPVHRAFSRAWIDFFDIPSVAHKCAHRATYLRPFCNGACEVTLRREFWSLDNFHCKAGGSLVFDIKDRVNAGDHFVLLLERLGDGEAAIVRVDGEPVAEFSLDDLAMARTKTWHQHFAVPIQLPQNSEEVSVTSPANCSAFLHGALLS